MFVYHVQYVESDWWKKFGWSVDAASVEYVSKVHSNNTCGNWCKTTLSQNLNMAC